MAQTLTSPFSAAVESPLGGEWRIADQITVTVNGKAVIYTTASSSRATILAGLVQVLSGSTIPEFAGIIWALGRLSFDRGDKHARAAAEFFDRKQ